MKVSIIGGTGLLGRVLAKQLTANGINYVSAGRSAEGPNAVKMDIATGAGLQDAVNDSDIVIHLASNPRKVKEVDIGGSRRLMEVVGDRHLIFMSIVGVDQHPLSFYQAKYQVEQMIARDVPNYSILRATQFHDLLASIMSKLSKPPICLVPHGFKFQPIDTAEVAERLVDIARSGPQGLLPDMAGPEILPVEDLARAYMTADGKERPVLKVPLPGKTARAFRDGINTNPGRAVGRKTWDEYLEPLR